jgi:hypothetical protein
MVYKKPNYNEMIEQSEECERFDFTDLKTFRIVIDEKEYALSKQYIFIKEKITLYVLREM